MSSEEFHIMVEWNQYNLILKLHNILRSNTSTLIENEGDTFAFEVLNLGSWNTNRDFHLPVVQTNNIVKLHTNGSRAQ